MRIAMTDDATRWHLVSNATLASAAPAINSDRRGAGAVVAIGPGVTTVAVGDHVALNWAPNCGHCFYCLHGSPNLCEAYLAPIWAGTMMDGTTRFALDSAPVYQYCALGCFSQWTVVPASSCVPLPKAVPLPVAALIGCAVTTGVGAALNTAQVCPGSTVAVFNEGVGLSVVMGARLTGAGRIIVVDGREAKRTIAAEFGATDFVLASEEVVAGFVP